MRQIRKAIYSPVPPPTGNRDTPRLSRSFVQDLRHADQLVARGVGVGSWTRNLSWANKFRNYLQEVCPENIRRQGVAAAAGSTSVVMAFLASISAENPRAPSRVTAAKRAINLIRALAGKPPADDMIGVQMLSKATAKAATVPQGQSNAMPIILVARIVARWRTSPVWWKRQVALMSLMALCVLARGAGIHSCIRKGVSWIRNDGTTYRGRDKPIKHCDKKECKRPNCVRGFLLLLPFRKNRQSQPTWMPVAERSAVQMLADHLQWLNDSGCKGDALFVARKVGRRNKRTVFPPNLSAESRMSTKSFRTILRQALVECCGLSAAQASRYGTHCFRLAAMELLRKRGVPAELRQQLGDWMSPKVALRYLQLDAASQFDILEQI